jgi:hypothetical protein
MLFNATFNNISVMSWWSALFVGGSFDFERHLMKVIPDTRRAH